MPAEAAVPQNRSAAKRESTRSPTGEVPSSLVVGGERIQKVDNPANKAFLDYYVALATLL